MNDIAFRQATPSDVNALLRHRRGMYEDMGYSDVAALEGIGSTCRNFLERVLAGGTLHAWLAESGKRVVGGAGILISPWPSHPYDQQCQRATILNMFVEPEFRRRGIARKLMQIMIEWCGKEGFIHVQLHASNQGRPLYESLGFKPTTEMQLKLQ